MKENLGVLRGLASALQKSGRLLSRTKFLLLISSVMFMSMGIAQVIKIEGRNMSLKQVLEEIKKQSGYSVFIRKDLLDNAAAINLQKKNRTVAELLEEVTKGQQLEYQIKGKEIVLTKANRSTGSTEHNTISQQTATVSGTVVDADGTPISNATIKASKSNIVARTNENGQFKIAVELPDNITITMMGFESKTVNVQNTNILKIPLVPKSVQVEDVVVNGIFSRPKENFTGSATVIKGEDLKKVSPTNVFKAISAYEPSFQIVLDNKIGGNINQVPEVQLRGQNSFPNLSGEISQKPNQPLFILDGFEVGIERIVDLDMNLIADITILKDASATSIYGSRAANGVMIVTTLSPDKGKLRVVFTNDFGLNTPDLSVYNFLNAAEKLEFEQRAMVYTAESPISRLQKDQIYNERLKAVNGGINTDWLRIPIQTGVNNRSTVYLSGGDEVIRYGIHATAGFQNGVMKNQDRKNYSGQFDFSFRTSKVLFSNSIRLYETKSNESNYGSFMSYAQMNPYWSPYDNEGKLKFYLENIVLDNNYSSTRLNPLFNSSLNTVDSQGLFGFQNNFQMRYNVIPSLFLEGQLSLGKEVGKSDKFLPAQHTSFDLVIDPKLKGSYSKSSSEALSYEANFMANYNKRFGQHLILGTIGANLASRRFDSYNVKAVGFAYDKLDHLLYGTQYEPNVKPTGAESLVNRLGYLFNANYSFDNRYLFDVSLRRDGSSQFGTNERFGTFWSIGAGWNLHHEQFLKNMESIDRLKLRSSYGSTGSLNIPAYSSQTRYSFLGQYIYDGEMGAMLQNIGNPNLGWQEKRELNIGLDLSLFKERLDVRLDHYRGVTNHTIIPISLAPSLGLGSYYDNLGKIKNEGYEINARYKLLDKKEKGILWSVFANAAHNKNTLVEISNTLKITNDKLNASTTENAKQTIPNIQFKEGESMNAIYVVRSLGIDPATGREVYLDINGNPTATWSSTDKVALGVTDPILRGTVGSNFIYKGFDINLLFDYKFGGQLYNQTLADRIENANVSNNVDRRAYDFGWTKPGDQSTYRFISIYNTNSPTRSTSRFVQDENTLNLMSASIGYTFTNQPFMKKIGLGTFKITATSTDLTRFSSIQIERGIENPYYRNYTLSLRASF